MENGNQMSGRCRDFAVCDAGIGAAAMSGTALAVVRTRLQLAAPSQTPTADWRDGIDDLLGWLGIDVNVVPACSARGVSRMPGWTVPPVVNAAAGVPVFAPWLCWSPAAFQHGGLASLPKAQWVASYLLECGVGLPLAPCGVDIALMSPLPAVCTLDSAAGVPLPHAAVLKGMIGAAKAERRSKLAIILHARQRNAVARQLMIADRILTRDGITLDILTIEDALRPLMDGGAPWDAIIAMPDVRSIVLAMLSHASGVRGPWPMLWHGQRGIQLITSEGGVDGMTRVPLDAPTLIHALALSLRHAGLSHSAWRLHEAWARLRDSGVTTPGRGSCAPYVSQRCDADFIAMLVKNLAPSKRPVRSWRALACVERPTRPSQRANLQVVASTNAPIPVQSKR